MSRYFDNCQQEGGKIDILMKRLLMLGLLVLASAAVFGLACAGLAGGRGGLSQGCISVLRKTVRK